MVTKEMLSDLRKQLEAVTQLQNSYGEAVKKVRSNQMWADGYKESELKKLDQHREQFAREKWKAILSTLQGMKESEERALPLGDPELLGAVQILGAAGQSLDGDLILNICDRFKGRNASQQLLSKVLRSVGKLEEAQHVENNIVGTDEFYDHVAQAMKKAVMAGTFGGLNEGYAYLEALENSLPEDQPPATPIVDEKSLAAGGILI